jgi:hypothetical protein
MDPKHWAGPFTKIYHDGIRKWVYRTQYVLEYDKVGWGMSITRDGKSVRLFSWGKGSLRDVQYCDSIKASRRPLIYKIPPLMGLE